MSRSTTYLVTGANRGIGKGLVATYLSRANSTVIAAVRDPDKESSKALSDLPKSQSSSLIVVKIDSSSTTDAAAAMKLLQEEHHITHIDVVVANAGITDSYQAPATIAIDEMKLLLNVNAIGSLILFQAVLPLLQKSQLRKFIAVSSPLGSIGGMESRPYPMVGYGASKAALNYIVRKIHFAHEDLVSFAVDPGFVQTDMGNAGAIAFGMKEASTTIKESVDGLVLQIDEATREKTSGRFVVFTGEEFAW